MVCNGLVGILRLCLLYYSECVAACVCVRSSREAVKVLLALASLFKKSATRISESHWQQRTQSFAWHSSENRRGSPSHASYS